MVKRLLLLNGIAILAVVCNHAAGWGYIAMFRWADRYQSIPVPNYDQINSLSYYLLVATKCLTPFAVPAFLFVSGFFMAYAALGNQAALSLIVKMRLKNLLIPYLIWSLVIFIGDTLEGTIYTLPQYLERLVIGGAHPVYFYIPLICQFYLLSPLLVPIGRTKAKQLLLVSALLQLGTLSLRYIEFFAIELPALRFATNLLFPMYTFFFAFGIVSGFNLQPITQWLVKVRWGLIVALVILGLLTLLESEVIYCLTEIRRAGGPDTISTNLYAVTFILCFLAFNKASIPFSKILYWLGSASFGIYLLHPKVLEFVARASQKFIPWILAYQVLFQPMLILLALIGPLLFMNMVANSRARRVYRYLFG